MGSPRRRQGDSGSRRAALRRPWVASSQLAGGLAMRKGRRMSDPEETASMLQAFLDAFNAHDVDAIMSFFTEDCVFDTPRGPAPGGRHLVGKQEVREGIQA